MRKKQQYVSTDSGLSPEAVQEELARVKYRERFRASFRRAVSVLIVVAAVAILLATTVMPVIRICGDSMAPLLDEGNIVLTLRGSSFEPGDVIGLYIGNKLLIKRIIAGPGQRVDISEKGEVSVDGVRQDEPYVTEKARGDCNIELPYQVPDGRYFVMGDRRATSLDSRNTAVGCIAEEQIAGRIFFRVWPVSAFGPIHQ